VLKPAPTWKVPVRRSVTSTLRTMRSSALPCDGRQRGVVEVAEPHDVELGQLLAGLRVEVALAQHHLAADHLVGGLVVAADVDALDVDQRALADLERHVELEVLLVLAGVGDDVDVGVAGVLVAALDVLDDGLDLAHRGDVALLEDGVDRLGEGALVVERLLAAGERLLGADAADAVLRALVDRDGHVDEAAVGAQRQLGVLDVGVEVALVAVERLEHLEVAGERLLVEDAAGALGDHAEVAADAGQHVLAQLLVRERLVADEGDLADDGLGGLADDDEDVDLAGLVLDGLEAVGDLGEEEALLDVGLLDLLDVGLDGAEVEDALSLRSRTSLMSSSLILLLPSTTILRTVGRSLTM
jgi:hypothetical protein